MTAESDDLAALFTIAQASPTWTDFRRAVRQKHLIDLSSQLFRWGRAFRVHEDDSPLVSVADIANGANREYLLTIRSEVPRTYQAIIAPGDRITVYRAVPKDRAREGLRIGDYVALDRAYATSHGRSVLSAQQKERYRVISNTIPKTDVVWGEADWSEWAFSPEKLRTYVSSLERLYAVAHGGSR